MMLFSLYCIVAGVAALTHQVRQSDTCATTPAHRAPKPNPFKELSNDELTEVRSWLMDPKQSLRLKDIDEAGLKDNYERFAQLALVTQQLRHRFTPQQW